MILLEVTLLLELLASAPVLHSRVEPPAAHTGSGPANMSRTSLQIYQEDPVFVGAAKQSTSEQDSPPAVQLSSIRDPHCASMSGLCPAVLGHLQTDYCNTGYFILLTFATFLNIFYFSLFCLHYTVGAVADID